MLEEYADGFLPYQLPVTLVFGVRYTLKAVMGSPAGSLESGINF